MATYVLVHGAWQGAGGWAKVKQQLESQGHTVHTPTLKGLGARKAELSKDVTLADHAADVVNYVTEHDLKDIVLVGHSYAGMVVTQAAEKLSDRIKSMGYLDAFYPASGQSAKDLLPAPLYGFLKQVAADHGDGWRLPGGDGQLDLWGLEKGSEERAEAAQGLCDFTIKGFESTVSLPTDAARTKPRGYLASVREGYPGRAAFAESSKRAKAERGVIYDELPTGHDAHLEQPSAVTRFLESLG